jgi:hypothetical protein
MDIVHLGVIASITTCLSLVIRDCFIDLGYHFAQHEGFSFGLLGGQGRMRLCPRPLVAMYWRRSVGVSFRFNGGVWLLEQRNMTVHKVFSQSIFAPKPSFAQYVALAIMQRKQSTIPLLFPLPFVLSIGLILEHTLGMASTKLQPSRLCATVVETTKTLDECMR